MRLKITIVDLKRFTELEQPSPSSTAKENAAWMLDLSTQHGSMPKN
jgi:hypothetical protein